MKKMNAIYDLDGGGIGRIYQNVQTGLVMVEPIGNRDILAPFALDEDEQPGGLMWPELTAGAVMDDATFADFVLATWGGPSGWNLRWVDDEMLAATAAAAVANLARAVEAWPT